MEEAGVDASQAKGVEDETDGIDRNDLPESPPFFFGESRDTANQRDCLADLGR